MNEFECKNPREVAEEALWLAWQSCGYAVGMGVFQDRHGVTKEDVINNVISAGDYPGTAMLTGRKPGEIFADYVFGRMMKFNLTIERNRILYPECALTPDYQSWCRVYKTYEDLLNSAVESEE